MDYILLSLVPKKAFSILEFQRIKERINKALGNEFVDENSIYWDETGELMFHPPVYRKDKYYWVKSLNENLGSDNWEFS